MFLFSFHSFIVSQGNCRILQFHFLFFFFNYSNWMPKHVQRAISRNKNFLHLFVATHACYSASSSFSCSDLMVSPRSVHFSFHLFSFHCCTLPCSLPIVLFVFLSVVHSQRKTAKGKRASSKNEEDRKESNEQWFSSFRFVHEVVV